jgi:hypothetical protein
MKKPKLKSHVTVPLIQECMQNVLPGQKPNLLPLMQQASEQAV